MEDIKIKILLKQKELLLQKISNLEEIRAIQESEIEEQEKIIELMAEKLVIYKFEEIICMETECEHIELQNEGKCIGDKECILEYFKKKARENND